MKRSNIQSRANGAHRGRLGHLVGAALPLLVVGAAFGQYTRTNLVSDQAGVALHQDANLVNPWGIAFNPNGFVWVSDNHSGLSTLYDGTGVANSLIVTVPSPTDPTGGSPTGIVFHGGNGFVVNGSSGSGPARFIFATEDGVISAWSPAAALSSSLRVVDNSAGNAVYKGLAITSDEHLFAADFHNGRIDAFNSDFSPANGFSFIDPGLPAMYAPFNARVLNNKVYVAYALQDDMGHDDVPGPGHGFITVFNLNGSFDHRLVSQGVLNSPWGMAIAPATFGSLAGALLVGNFGDGRINAFDPVSGASRGTLNDTSGQPIVIEGLWGIEFGNNLLSQPTHTLFFAAGPDDEGHGLYGRIDPPCYPNCDGSIAAPFLNVNDFVCFQQKFAAGDTYANCDGSTTPPVLNIDDFVCYMRTFTAGCP